MRTLAIHPREPRIFISRFLGAPNPLVRQRRLRLFKISIEQHWPLGGIEAD